MGWFYLRRPHWRVIYCNCFIFPASN